MERMLHGQKLAVACSMRDSSGRRGRQPRPSPGYSSAIQPARTAQGSQRSRERALPVPPQSTPQQQTPPTQSPQLQSPQTQLLQLATIASIKRRTPVSNLSKLLISKLCSKSSMLHALSTIHLLLSHYFLAAAVSVTVHCLRQFISRYG